jgi:uncharacterized SAM-binding protein YcdF (DUF218 family)
MPAALRLSAITCTRGFALFFGSFGLANVALGLVRPGLDANLFWSGLPSYALAPLSVALLWWSCAPHITLARRAACAAAVALTVGCAIDALGVAQAERSGTVALDAALSLSAILAALFAVAALVIRRSAGVPHATSGVHALRRRGAVVLGAGTCAALFPLALSLTLGRSDYRGPADAIIVFGARAYADGRLSHALEDRVETAAKLYRAGLAPRLWMSGGPGDGDVHEVEAMRDAAIELGVAADHIALDFEGWNTAATARNLAPRLPEGGRVIAVSHGFHLARVRLAFARAGFDVVTVPADSPDRPLAARTRLHLRDAAGFWAYWVGYGAS